MLAGVRHLLKWKAKLRDALKSGTVPTLALATLRHSRLRCSHCTIFAQFRLQVQAECTVLKFTRTPEHTWSVSELGRYSGLDSGQEQRSAPLPQQPEANFFDISLILHKLLRCLHPYVICESSFY